MASSDRVLARGLDHIGITVPDVEAATRFFVEVFGAELLHDTIARDRNISFALEGPAIEGLLGLPAGAALRAVRLLRLGNGPSVELFEYEAAQRQGPQRPSDWGLQHFAVYVDDLDAACERIKQHGGELMAGPTALFGPESGASNRFRYTRAPWGTTIELISYPSAQAYEADTELRRWRPAR